MSDEEPAIVMAWPISWPKAGGPQEMAGTITVTADCGHEVRQAPSTKEILAKYPHAQVQCIPCVMGNADVDELRKHLTVTPDQRAELNANIGTGETDQVLARLGITEKEL